MNLGTVGTSWITSTFIDAAHKSGKLTLKGVYSRSLEKAQELAGKYAAPFVFTNLDEMAESAEIEVVYIASPNSMHFEHVMTFLKNKKHVICEKPIFSNTKELEAAFLTAEENGVFLFEAIRNLHAPNMAILKKQLHKAGKITGTMLHYIQYSSRYDLFLKGEEPNIFSSRFSGGALVDLGVYPLYVAVALFGKPDKASYQPVMLRSGVDGSGTLTLQYKDFVATILCSKISHSTMPNEIHGEKGTFILQDAAPITTLQFRSNQDKEIEELGVGQDDQDMVYEIERFTNIINANAQEKYQELKELSKIVLSITEDVRQQNGIIFETEK